MGLDLKWSCKIILHLTGLVSWEGNFQKMIQKIAKASNHQNNQTQNLLNILMSVKSKQICVGDAPTPG